MGYAIYTDGGCSGNRRDSGCPGGYGYVIIYKKKVLKTGGGAKANTTNNRMEMTAVIAGLSCLKKYLIDKNVKSNNINCEIITDSRYVCDNWNDYFDIWKKSGWRKSNGKQVLNVDLWKMIESEASDFRSVIFQWVKGHASNLFNEQADSIACDFIQKSRKEECVNR